MQRTDYGGKGKVQSSGKHVNFAEGGAVPPGLPSQDVLARADTNFQQAKLLKKALKK